MSWGRSQLEYGSPRALTLRGTGLVVTVASLAWIAGWVISGASWSIGSAGVFLEAAALKFVISLRGLLGACAYRVINTADAMVSYHEGPLEGRAGNAWKTMWRDCGRTASLNAGWTMAAMAGALGVTLQKIGAYRLGEGGAPRIWAHRPVASPS